MPYFFTDIAVVDRMEDQKRNQPADTNRTMDMISHNKKMKSIVKHSMTNRLPDLDSIYDFSEISSGK